MSNSVRIDLLHGRQVLRATLPAGRRQDATAPIGLRAVVDAVSSALEGDPTTAARTKLVVFASERDLRVDASFAAQRDAFERLIELGMPTMAVVRGACRGGGLALASFCNFIFAERSASFGGDGTPGAALDPAFPVLALKLGESAALELLLAGGALPTPEAYRMGLVTAWTTGDGALETLVQRWVEAHILPAPRDRLRMANRAARLGFHRHLRSELPVLATLDAPRPVAPARAPALELPPAALWARPAAAATGARLG